MNSLICSTHCDWHCPHGSAKREDCTQVQHVWFNGKMKDPEFQNWLALAGQQAGLPVIINSPVYNAPEMQKPPLVAALLSATEATEGVGHSIHRIRKQRKRIMAASRASPAATG